MRRLLAPIPIAVLCAVVALVALLAYGLASNEPDRKVDDAVAAGERDPAPDIELSKLDGGGTASLADYRGKVVVLNYWASWCDPCRARAAETRRGNGGAMKRETGLEPATFGLGSRRSTN